MSTTLPFSSFSPATCLVGGSHVPIFVSSTFGTAWPDLLTAFAMYTSVLRFATM